MWRRILQLWYAWPLHASSRHFHTLPIRFIIVRSLQFRGGGSMTLLLSILHPFKYNLSLEQYFSILVMSLIMVWKNISKMDSNVLLTRFYPFLSSPWVSWYNIVSHYVYHERFSGSFPSDFKIAIVRPLLQQSSLDQNCLRNLGGSSEKPLLDSLNHDSLLDPHHSA